MAGMGEAMRGDVRTLRDRRVPDGVVVVVGREALAQETGRIACVPVRREPRGLPSEVELHGIAGAPEGAVIAADEPIVVEVSSLGGLLGELGPLTLEELDGALRYVLDVPGPIPGRRAALEALG
jgi:mRNA-degrading endonuclease toxin of MazEF toxin-antitoxin module